MKLCLFGAASNDIADVFYSDGLALGRRMAQRGHSLIFGGGDSGMMGAVARGMSEYGGHITGIAPSFFNVDGVLYERCDDFIYTDTMRERKQRMEELSDGFIVSPGGIGTMEEFFEIFTLRQLGRHQKPIAILNTDGYFDPMLRMLRHTADCRFMSELNLQLFYVSGDVDRLLDYLEQPDLSQPDPALLRRTKPKEA